MLCGTKRTRISRQVLQGCHQRLRIKWDYGLSERADVLNILSSGHTFLSAARLHAVLGAMTITSAASRLPPKACTEEVWCSSKRVLKSKDQEVKKICHVPGWNHSWLNVRRPRHTKDSLILKLEDRWCGYKIWESQSHALKEKSVCVLQKTGL